MNRNTRNSTFGPAKEVFVSPLVSSLPGMLAGIHTGAVIASPSLVAQMSAASEHPVKDGQNLYFRNLREIPQEPVSKIQGENPFLANFPDTQDFWFAAALWFQHCDKLPKNKPLVFLTRYHVFAMKVDENGMCSLRVLGKHIFFPHNTVTVSMAPDHASTLEKAAEIVRLGVHDVACTIIRNPPD